MMDKNLMAFSQNLEGKVDFKYLFNALKVQNFNFFRYNYAYCDLYVTIERKPANGEYALSTLPLKKVGSG